MLGEGAQHGIDRVAAFIRSKTYNDYFAPFNSSVKMHRTVRDYFDRNIHDKAEEVAANLLTNIPTWNPMYSESALWNYYMTQAENAKPTNDWHSHAVELKMFNLLFLYNYWDRFLNFTMGGSEEVGLQNNANAFLIVAFRGGVIKPGLSLVNMTYDVRSDSMLSYSWVRLLSNTVVYNRLRPFSGIGDTPTLIRTLVARASDYDDVANWFADYMSSIAFYHEYKPPVIQRSFTGAAGTRRRGAIPTTFPSGSPWNPALCTWAQLPCSSPVAPPTSTPLLLTSSSTMRSEHPSRQGWTTSSLMPRSMRQRWRQSWARSA